MTTCPDCGKRLTIIHSKGSNVRARCWCGYYALGRMERERLTVTRVVRGRGVMNVLASEVRK